MNTKKLLLGLALLAATGVASAANVGVTLRVGDPNFYGVIDLGDAPPPRLVYREPRLVRERVVVEQPLYLRVPRDHREHWDRYCDRYDACGRRVYFVEDDWYQKVYAPAWRERHWEQRHEQAERIQEQRHENRDQAERIQEQRYEHDH